MIRALLPLITGAAVAQVAQAAPAARAVSEAHMASMDAYFGCAFAVMRSSRADGAAADGYMAALDRECASQEQALRRHSRTMFAARGESLDQARAKADAAVDAARKDLLGVYRGQ